MKTNFIETKLIPFAARLGNQRHLSSIRDGFALMMPIIIAGSFAALWNAVLFSWSGGQSSLTGLIYHTLHITDAKWKLDKTIVGPDAYDHIKWFAVSINRMFIWVQTVAFDMVTIWAVLGVGYMILNNKGVKHPFIGTLVLLAAWLATTDTLGSPGGKFGWDTHYTTWFSAKGLFAGLLVALLGGELYSWLEKNPKLTITMPKGIPPAVARAFASLIPSVLTILSFSLLSWACWAGMHFGVPGGVSKDKLPGQAKTAWTFTSTLYFGFMRPFLDVFDSTSAQLSLILVYLLVVRVFWWLGVHGSNVAAGIFGPILTLFTAKNISNYGHGLKAENIFTLPVFTAFIFMGTAGILIASMIFSKTKDRKALNKIAAVPRIFNIGEPVMYGYPVVLNIFYLVPFVFGEFFIGITTYFALTLGWVAIPIASVPWTTPAFLSGLIVTGFDYRSIFLTAVNLAIIVAIFVPFVFAENKALLKIEKASEAAKPAKA